jgi:hypothetical protein
MQTGEAHLLAKSYASPINEIDRAITGSELLEGVILSKRSEICPLRSGLGSANASHEVLPASLRRIFTTSLVPRRAKILIPSLTD